MQERLVRLARHRFFRCFLFVCSANNRATALLRAGRLTNRLCPVILCIRSRLRTHLGAVYRRGLRNAARLLGRPGACRCLIKPGICRTARCCRVRIPGSGPHLGPRIIYGLHCRSPIVVNRILRRELCCRSLIKPGICRLRGRPSIIVNRILNRQTCFRTRIIIDRILHGRLRGRPCII